MGTDLKPCPFCGEAAYQHQEQDADWSGKKFMFVKCRGCGAEGMHVYGSGDPSEWQEARAAWNRRAAAMPEGGQG